MRSHGELIAALEMIADQLPAPPEDLEARVVAEVARAEPLPRCDLDHLHLKTGDLRHAREFYEQWFHFRGGTVVGDTLFIHNPHGFLLCLTPAVEVQPLPDGVHFGFTLPSAEAVERLWTAMRSEGVPVDDLHSSDGFASFHCNDPDGRVIELFWEAPAHFAPTAPQDRKGDTSG